MNKENKAVLPDGVTDEMLKAWKQKYGEDKLRLAELKKDESGTRFPVVMHVPDRQTIGEFEKWSDSNPNKAKEILIKGSTLTCIDEIMENDLLFLSAFNACSKLIPRAESEIKNL
jgi:hypothetical protein